MDLNFINFYFFSIPWTPVRGSEVVLFYAKFEYTRAPLVRSGAFMARGQGFEPW